MKGVILAAGKGSRLYPITYPICKPLLPVYDKPMIYYPLSVLMKAGIRDVLVIIPPGEQTPFKNLLGNGEKFGIHIEYKEQIVQRGIADAFIVGEEFIGDDAVCLILGDNIFFGPSFSMKLRDAANLQHGAKIFGYYVQDPRAFGVVEFDKEGKALSIEEKPAHPKSNFIVPGLYFYDNEVIKIAKEIQPSARGELEITDVNNKYLEAGELCVIPLSEEYTWFDAGTADSLYKSAGTIRTVQRSGHMIACLEEQAVRNGWITLEQLQKQAEALKQTAYGQYLFGVISDLIIEKI